MSLFKLDAIDYKILSLLQQDSSISNKDLAQAIGLSPAPTLERVKKLEEEKIIENYYVQLNRQKLGLGIGTFVMVTLTANKKNTSNAFIGKINEIPEVTECHHITGHGNFLLKIIAKDMDAFYFVLSEKIREIEEVASTETMFILATMKDYKGLPIPTPK